MAKSSGGIFQHVPQVLNRVRAWFLIKTSGDNPAADAKIIYDNWIDYWIDPDKKKPPTADLVVIRADVVDSHVQDPEIKEFFDFDLIVPVDALNAQVLEQFKLDLESMISIDKLVVATVKEHHPMAPYLSNGYISIDEAKDGLATHLPESLRLTRKSPGDNPWG